MMWVTCLISWQFDVVIYYFELADVDMGWLMDSLLTLIAVLRQLLCSLTPFSRQLQDSLL